MPAAVYVGDSNITVEERPVPELGPDDVLVEVSHCGICGTDLHLVFEHYARPGSILGHEWSGTVVDAGATARDQFLPDRIGILAGGQRASPAQAPMSPAPP